MPAVGSVYPVPPFPVNYFPYIFLAYLAIGVIWVLSFRFRVPERLEQIRMELKASHAIAGSDELLAAEGSA